jgi:hypothetical protein
MVIIKQCSNIDYKINNVAAELSVYTLINTIITIGTIEKVVLLRLICVPNSCINCCNAALSTNLYYKIYLVFCIDFGKFVILMFLFLKLLVGRC